MKTRHDYMKPNKADPGNGSHGIFGVIDASRSSSPDPMDSFNDIGCL